MADCQTNSEFVAPTSEVRLCPCCRKRERGEGLRTCTKCGSHKTKYCKKCGENEIKGRRNWCDDCMGEESDQSSRWDDLPEEWRRRVMNSMSSLRQRARRNPSIKKTATESEVRELILNQGFRCALTGVKLKPDGSTVLGHKFAIASGADSSIDNLYWITRDANGRQKEESMCEFVAFCKGVTKHQASCSRPLVRVRRKGSCRATRTVGTP